RNEEGEERPHGQPEGQVGAERPPALREPADEQPADEPLDRRTDDDAHDGGGRFRRRNQRAQPLEDAEHRSQNQSQPRLVHLSSSKLPSTSGRSLCTASCELRTANCELRYSGSLQSTRETCGILSGVRVIAAAPGDRSKTLTLIRESSSAIGPAASCSS